MEVATLTIACVGCSKSLIDVQKPPICTNCKIVYCTAKCKKAHVKVHKKTCKWIPSDSIVPETHECADDCHDHHVPTRNPLDSARFLYLGGKIPIITTRGMKWMEIDPKLQSIIYPDGLCNTNIDIINMADGSVVPCMSDNQAAHLFGMLYVRNATELSLLIPDTDIVKSTGCLEAEYRSAIDFATAYVNNRTDEFKWVDTSTATDNSHSQPCSHAINTIDNVLFGRIRIQGVNSGNYAVSIYMRLDPARITA